MLHATLGLDDILQREITTDWFEGVAVIQAVCRAVPGVSTSGTGFPTARQISHQGHRGDRAPWRDVQPRRCRGGRPAAWRNAPQRRAGPPAIDSQRGGCEPPRFRNARRARGSACLLRAAGRPTDAPDTVRPGRQPHGNVRARQTTRMGSARRRCPSRTLRRPSSRWRSKSRAEPKASTESVVSGCASESSSSRWRRRRSWPTAVGNACSRSAAETSRWKDLRVLQMIARGHSERQSQQRARARHARVRRLRAPAGPVARGRRCSETARDRRPRDSRCRWRSREGGQRRRHSR